MIVPRFKGRVGTDITDGSGMEGVFVAKRSEVINIIGTHVMCIPILTGL